VNLAKSLRWDAGKEGECLGRKNVLVKNKVYLRRDKAGKEQMGWKGGRGGLAGSQKKAGEKEEEQSKVKKKGKVGEVEVQAKEGETSGERMVVH